MSLQFRVLELYMARREYIINNVGWVKREGVKRERKR